ncbi:biotin--[acetyl-CoA-carboxylase] ligase [Verrucomicrobiales bacterium]|jgi:BirA family biotin operon repressor/biotin-[acetyl-CoA-carboxylase] ligase|nr:biotin--[acetyl-CoA-carboxylase] ligase [Verrucomicrobiales bacterium]MDC0049538.1 biotin--[acetyl-CoA-carboxylase] ligase [Verrucomicrobiota bacterium]|tara:strand:+ start:3695 stop:4513 length:819 start_codon:yes stop_codon:yes gene_type:complete
MSNLQELNVAQIANNLSDKGIHWSIRSLGKCASTNAESYDIVKRNPELTNQGLVLFTEWQSDGKGRRGGKWESPRSKDLLFSIAICPDLAQSHWSRLTHAAALGICKALSTEFKPQIKWPNDIYIGNKKVSGILVESHPSTTTGTVIIGIGINVNSVPQDLNPQFLVPGTSLCIENDEEPLIREQIAESILFEIHNEIRQCKNNFNVILNQIEELSVIHGKNIHVTLPNSKKIVGVASGFGEEGELILKTIPESGKGSKMLKISAAHEIRLQ